MKASNVLLDAEMNARLGDFGLARLYDHNTKPQPTRMVGTKEYIAPGAENTKAYYFHRHIFFWNVFA